MITKEIDENTLEWIYVGGEKKQRGSIFVFIIGSGY